MRGKKRQRLSRGWNMAVGGQMWGRQGSAWDIVTRDRRGRTRGWLRGERKGDEMTRMREAIRDVGDKNWGKRREEKGLNHCLLSARTEGDTGSLAITDLWLMRPLVPTQNKKRDMTKIGVEASSKNAYGGLMLNFHFYSSLVNQKGFCTFLQYISYISHYFGPFSNPNYIFFYVPICFSTSLRDRKSVV